MAAQVLGHGQGRMPGQLGNDVGDGRQLAGSDGQVAGHPALDLPVGVAGGTPLAQASSTVSWRYSAGRPVTSARTAAASASDSASGPVTSSTWPSSAPESSSRAAAPTSARSSRDTKLTRPSPAGAAMTARPSCSVAKKGTKSAYIEWRRKV